MDMETDISKRQPLQGPQAIDATSLPESHKRLLASLPRDTMESLVPLLLSAPTSLAHDDTRKIEILGSMSIHEITATYHDKARELFELLEKDKAKNREINAQLEKLGQEQSLERKVMQKMVEKQDQRKEDKAEKEAAKKERYTMKPKVQNEVEETTIGANYEDEEMEQGQMEER